MYSHPPASFFFAVSFYEQSSEAQMKAAKRFGADYDIAFQSVTGLSSEMETESYREGGENRFAHQLPTKAKYSNLVLKRGLIIESDFIKWCTDTFEHMIIKPKDAHIELRNEQGEPLFTWHVKHVWPKKWAVSDLNAERGELSIETLELHYHYFTVAPGSYAESSFG